MCLHSVRKVWYPLCDYEEHAWCYPSFNPVCLAAHIRSQSISLWSIIHVSTYSGSTLPYIYKHVTECKLYHGEAMSGTHVNKFHLGAVVLLFDPCNIHGSKSSWWKKKQWKSWQQAKVNNNKKWIQLANEQPSLVGETLKHSPCNTEEAFDSCKFLGLEQPVYACDTHVKADASGTASTVLAVALFEAKIMRGRRFDRHG